MSRRLGAGAEGVRLRARGLSRDIGPVTWTSRRGRPTGSGRPRDELHARDGRLAAADLRARGRGHGEQRLPQYELGGDDVVAIQPERVLVDVLPQRRRLVSVAVARGVVAARRGSYAWVAATRRRRWGSSVIRGIAMASPGAADRVRSRLKGAPRRRRWHDLGIIDIPEPRPPTPIPYDRIAILVMVLLGVRRRVVTRPGSRRHRGDNVDGSWTEAALFRYYVPHGRSMRPILQAGLRTGRLPHRTRSVCRW